MKENDQPTSGSPGAAEDLEKASLDTVFEKLRASHKELTSADAKARLEKYGRNEPFSRELSVERLRLERLRPNAACRKQSSRIGNAVSGLSEL